DVVHPREIPPLRLPVVEGDVHRAVAGVEVVPWFSGGCRFHFKPPCPRASRCASPATEQSCSTKRVARVSPCDAAVMSRSVQQRRGEADGRTPWPIPGGGRRGSIAPGSHPGGRRGSDALLDSGCSRRKTAGASTLAPRPRRGPAATPPPCCPARDRK